MRTKINLPALSNLSKSSQFQLQRIDGDNYYYMSEKYKGLDIVLNRNEAKVYLNEDFDKSKFYELWIYNQGNLVLTIDMEDYDTSWNLETFYFLPYLKTYKTHLFYDLMSEKEKQYFRGLGASVFKLLINHIMIVNKVNSDVFITTGATDVKALEKEGDLSKLVKFYESLSFKIDYSEYDNFMKENGYNRHVTPDTLLYEIKNVGKPGFLKYVPMITTFGKILS
jgi:hypothetical protein